MGLGMPEVILILVVALILFGPRKLPDLGKSLGQAMSQFRRASEDFKRTWEQEVEIEKTRKGEGGNDSSYQSASSDSYSSGSYPYENPRYEPEAAGYPAQSLEGGNEPKAESSSSVQEPGKNGPTAEPAATTAARPPEKQHWI
jgi:TatA/E family protein of Tat protein translocase